MTSPTASSTHYDVTITVADPNYNGTQTDTLTIERPAERAGGAGRLGHGGLWRLGEHHPDRHRLRQRVTDLRRRVGAIAR